jgi:hypothetical protein
MKPLGYVYLNETTRLCIFKANWVESSL